MWGAKEDYRVIGSSCPYPRSFHTPRWQSFNVISWFWTFCKGEGSDHGSSWNGVWGFNKERTWEQGVESSTVSWCLCVIGLAPGTGETWSMDGEWHLDSSDSHKDPGKISEVCSGDPSKVCSWLRSWHIAGMGILSYLTCSFQMDIEGKVGAGGYQVPLCRDPHQAPQDLWADRYYSFLT